MTTPEQVIAASCREFGATPEEVMRPHRGVRRIATARQVAMYLTADLLGKTPTQVGEAFRRDRTSARHAVLTVQLRLEADPEFRAAVERVRAHA